MQLQPNSTDLVDAYVARTKRHLSLIIPTHPKATTIPVNNLMREAVVRYVVRPLYLKQNGNVVKRLYLVFDMQDLAYDICNDKKALRPNYAVEAGGNMVGEISEHFSSKGVGEREWRLTPPYFGKLDEEYLYLGSAEITSAV